MVNTLIVFVKKPCLGKVKTRLAKTMGNEVALKVYGELLEKTKETILYVDCNVAIYYDESDGPGINWGRVVNVFFQVGNDLGERMQNAISTTLQSTEKVVLIGSDCPGITKEIIHDAFLALEDQDVVIGPTEDGGYYLIGMKKKYPELFDKIAWSTPDVLTQTLGAIQNIGASFSTLPILRDVDVEKDYRFYVEKGILRI